MILHFNNTTLEVQENDSSYRYRSLMSKPQLVLKFSLPTYVEFPVGTYCEYQGETYILHSPQNIKKNGVRNIEYTLNMGTLQDDMSLYKMRNTVDRRLKYSMTAKPHEFIDEIIANLNQRDGANVWSRGTCIDGDEKTIEFNHTNVDAALSQVAETFETEWEIVGHVIHLHRVEYFKNDPLPLSYGKGNGFMPGVGRTTPSNEMPIKRLYVQGGDRNIDRSEYGAPELLLPRSQTLGYDGTHFEDEQGYDSSKAHIYQSDADGYYIERIDVVSDAVKEDSLDCSSHYPKRVGTVSSVIAVKPEKNFYDFIDNTIPADLDFNDYIIEGETATVIFQTGMLAGEKEFEFKYKHATRRFELVPQDIDGQTMPNATFIPCIGDQYAVFGIMLPSYICDNTNKEGASWDMMREAVKHLYENEGQKFTFQGTLQSLYAKRNWVNIGGKLKVGGYVHFTDTQFAQDGVDIRITGIKDFLTSPYAPTVEISNSVAGQSLTSKLREIDAQEVIIDENHKAALQFTKRRFRDAQETLTMLEGALDNFSESVNPISVQTMAMLVGDESLQFQFVTARDSATIDTSFQVTYDAANKQLSVPHSFLRHMTLGIDSIKSSHAISEYKTWEMTAYLSARLDDGSKKYYLYAVVSSSDTTQLGNFILSETAIDMNAQSGYYHLLVGVLNSEFDEQRSYVSLYGFTEILPARITTDRIVSADGLNCLDLLNNALHLGNGTDYLDWNNEESATLIMSNATIKNALKVLGEALIAGFYFSNQIIKSSAQTGQDAAMYLNGLLGKIHLKSNNTGGDYSLDNIGSEIDIDASSGDIEVRNNNGVAYMSASGVFCNNPKTNALPASSGYTHYGSIVGLGFGNIDNTWQWDKESTLIAGLYGRASNSGTALAYGAYVWDLLAAGLILRQKYVGDSYKDYAYQIPSGVTQIVGLSNSGVTAQAVLPSDGMEGKVIYVKQIGLGAVRITAKSGQKIYDDDSENAYYEAGTGQELKFTFAKYNINSVTTEVWLVSRWKF